MASRSISAILWTLVSVNVITLVVGGLITWLGYAIPVRLKQFGLLPGLVIIAGFASLIVACIGLCALNYSSHHALNIYGISCTVFVLMLIFGIPETWYKSQQFVPGGSLLMDIIYFALIFILAVLLVFAFVFAQYLRRKQEEEMAYYGGGNNNNNNSAGFDHQNHQMAAAGHEGHCNSPSCSCKLQHPNARNSSQSRSSNRHTSIKDRWLNWTGNGNNDSNISRSCHHLSSIHLPVFNSNYNRSNLNCAPKTQVAQLQVDAAAAANDNKCLPLAQCPPLIHKGFYHSGGQQLIRSRSSNHPLNEPHQTDDDSDEDEQQQVTHQQSLLHRSTSSEQCLAQTTTRDDNLVRYGTQQQQQQQIYQQQQHRQPLYQLPTGNQMLRNSSAVATAVASPYLTPLNNTASYYSNSKSNTIGPTCSCHLGGARSLAAMRFQATPSMFAGSSNRKYLGSFSQYDAMSRTMPRLTSASSAYAMRSKPKIRAKGSSSVVAMTAAAAAALLGGVADTCPMQTAEDDGGLFAGTCDGIGDDGDCGDAGMSNVRCNFDNNDHQLNASMLNVGPNNSSYHQNVCRQPVLDFAPLLDFRKH